MVEGDDILKRKRGAGGLRPCATEAESWLSGGSPLRALEMSNFATAARLPPDAPLT
jgi:hypothetical protein